MRDRELTIDSLFDDAGAQDAPAFVRKFAHAPGTRVHFGIGAVERTGEFTRTTGASKVLVVTDPGIEDAGHLERVLGSLAVAGLPAVVFDKVIQNPTTETVDACLAVARAEGIDAIVGLGGGSSMDTAKGCNFLFSNGGRMRDYWGIGKATKPMLPLVVVPTTAGTGSECQSFALISDAVTHRKMACGDKKAAARHAVLDPELTLTMPAGVTAVTGIDAIAHAVESAVCTKGNEISAAYSSAAFRLLSHAFPGVAREPANIQARAMMQVGAALAGVAIENAMLGAAHAAANPLTARFDIIHGIAVGVMLPHVVRHNSADPTAAAIYRKLSPQRPLADRLAEFLDAADLPSRLDQCGVDGDALPLLAAEAAGQWTATFNPTPIDEAGFLRLYQQAA
jgi:alcohol dehydrogenase